MKAHISSHPLKYPDSVPFSRTNLAFVLVKTARSRSDFSLGIKKDFLMVFEPRLIVLCYQKCHCCVGQDCSQPAGRSWKGMVPFRGVAGFLWINAGPGSPGTDLVLSPQSRVLLPCVSTSSWVPPCVTPFFLELTHTIPTQGVGDV